MDKKELSEKDKLIRFIRLVLQGGCLIWLLIIIICLIGSFFEYLIIN